MQDEAYRRARETLEPFLHDLYEDKIASDAEMPDEDAPLYAALTEITERYENPTLIGKGGMKEVYSVFDAHATREVVMAKLKSERGHDYFDAFIREAHITARLDHPAIIKLLDMGIDEDARPFFTMEFKRGKSLRQLLHDLHEEDEVLSIRQRLTLLLRICEAIAYAHSRHVVHLDLKPENIQIGTFGEVQVCDWGMGVVLPHGDADEVFLDPDLYGSLKDQAKGTPGYMAPEQYTPEEARSVSMDIYALGCLMQELVTLSAPEAPTWPKDKSLAAMIKKARAESPTDRYALVDELRRDITRYLEGYSTTVETSGIVNELFLFYRRNWAVCTVVLVFLVLSVIGTALSIQRLQHERNEAETARSAAETALQQYLAEKQISAERLLAQVEMAELDVAEMTRRDVFLNKHMNELLTASHRQLDAVIANDAPAESPVWGKKLWLCFIAQDFAVHDRPKVVAKLREHGGRYGDLLPLAETFAPRVNEAGHLPTEDFCELIKTLLQSEKAHRTTVEIMLCYDFGFPRSAADRNAILKATLEGLNPDWQGTPFSFKRGRLRIGGKGLSMLCLQRLARHKAAKTFLRFWDPKHLDVRGTSIEYAQHFDGLGLLTLDVSETPIDKHLKRLFDMRTLRTLIIDKGKLTTPPPSHIEVIEK